jgi:hypothetical protein
MKKSMLLVCAILLALSSCKKEEYIKHNSQIFLNNNTLVIGTWDYLFTIVGGGYVNSINKSFQDLPDLKIYPTGEYEKFKDGVVLSKGVIDTVKTIHDVLYVKFYPNGIKTSVEESQALIIQNSDTLSINTASGDTYKSEYYKRF